MKKLSILFLFTVACSYCFGQSDSSKFAFSLAAEGGFLMPHHSVMNYMVQDHVRGGEISIDRITRGEKDWHHYFNFPTYGVTLSFYDLGSEYLGKGASLVSHMNFPLEPSRSIFLKAGFGLGYIQKPFDLENNLYNSAIGSRLNAAIKLHIKGRVVLTKWLAVWPGIGISHFSNGAVKKPNKGINVASANLGIEFLGGRNKSKQERLNPSFPKGNGAIYIGGSAGIKQLSIEGNRYLVLNAFGLYLNRISPKSSLGGELGCIIDQSLPDAMRQKDIESDRQTDYLRPYLALAYKLHFGKLGFMLQAGGYLHNSYKSDGTIFLRYNLQYQLNQKWILFAGLKSHYAKADNPEIGAAFSLK